MPMPAPGRTWYLTLEYLFGVGSGDDSSGVGSNDQNPTIAATSANDVNSGKSNLKLDTSKTSAFYIAPKLIYTKQKAMYGPRQWELGPGELATFNGVPNQNQNGAYVAPADSGPLPPIPGGGMNDSYFGGGLALGVDLYKLFNIPLRVEIEASSHYDGYMEFNGLTPFLLDNVQFQDFVNAGHAGADGFIEVDSSTNELNYRSHLAFINIFFDFHNKTRFTPYVGGGMGLSFVQTRLHTNTTAYVLGSNQIAGGPLYIEKYDLRRDLNFAWNIGAGFSFKINDNVELDLSYRYVNTGFKENSDDNVTNNIYNYRRSTGNWNTFWSYTYSYKGVEIDLSEAHQVIFATRFSF
jgi:opacity protein-like surface antigen